MTQISSAQQRESPSNGQTVKFALGDVLARRIVGAIADEFSRRILASTITEAKCARAIGSEQAVPLSTCYGLVKDVYSLKPDRSSKL